jgi:hypothetical protein
MDDEAQLSRLAAEHRARDLIDAQLQTAGRIGLVSTRSESRFHC